MGHPERRRFPAVKKRTVSACFTGGDVTGEGGSTLLRQKGAARPARGILSIFETVMGFGGACKRRMQLPPVPATPVCPALIPPVIPVLLRFFYGSSPMGTGPPWEKNR